MDEVTIQKLIEERDGLTLKVNDLEKNIKALEKMLDQATPEAVYSFSTTALSRDGMSATWTVRARHGEDGKAFFHRVENFLQYAVKNGWTVPSKIQTSAQQQTSTPPTKSADASKAGVSDEVETFKAQSMTATVNEGKAYWKVKGGKYGKFGLTIWREALEEAGFDFEKLDPMQTYDLSGFTAYVWRNEEGKPTKVFKLTK